MSGPPVENENKKYKSFGIKKKMPPLFTHKRQNEFHLLTFPACLPGTQANVRTSGEGGRGGERGQFHLLAQLGLLNPLAFCWLLIQQKLLLQNS